MMNRFRFCLIALVPLATVRAQDTSVNVQGRYIQLSEVVVRSDINVANFIRRVQEDTTFYKAFKNLRILSYSSINDIRMVDKHGDMVASLNSRTHQSRVGNCRTMQIIDETSTGDIQDKEGNWNYITAQLYAALFFTNGSVCGENNVVAGSLQNVDRLSGMEKHKEQLKLLFFNPGKPIPGVPFLGNKMDIFSPDAAKHYDYHIDLQRYNGQDCYVFKIKAKDDARGSVVIDEMTTWFDPKTMDVLGRVYDMSYDAGVYDFNVHMEVQLSKYGNLLVPTLLRYNGNWGVIFKKRERGIFTATLFDFGK
jgi:hypothetical protein